MSKYILMCDLEGVISNNKHRLHLARAKDWEAYNKGFDDDLCDPVILASLSMFRAAGWKIVISTGMHVEKEVIAKNWLTYWCVHYDTLMMRDNWELPTPSIKAKHCIDASMAFPHYRIKLAIDDRMKNIRLYESLEIPTIYIPGSDY